MTKKTQSEMNRENGIKKLLLHLEVEKAGGGTSDLLKIARMADPFGVYAEALERFTKGAKK